MIHLLNFVGIFSVVLVSCCVLISCDYNVFTFHCVHISLYSHCNVFTFLVLSVSIFDIELAEFLRFPTLSELYSLLWISSVM